MQAKHAPRPFRPQVGNVVADKPSKVATLYLRINGARIYIARRPVRANETPEIVDLGEQCDGCGENAGTTLRWRPASNLFRCEECGTTYGIRSDE